MRKRTNYSAPSVAPTLIRLDVQEKITITLQLARCAICATRFYVDLPLINGSATSVPVIYCPAGHINSLP